MFARNVDRETQICLCGFHVAGRRQRRHGDALLLPVRGEAGPVLLLQQAGTGPASTPHTGKLRLLFSHSLVHY